jgi:hypothetical protein
MLHNEEMRRLFGESYTRIGYQAQPLMAESRDLGSYLVVTLAVINPDRVIALRIEPRLSNVERMIPIVVQFAPFGFELSHMQVVFIPSGALRADQRIFELDVNTARACVPRWQLRFRCLL